MTEHRQRERHDTRTLDRIRELRADGTARERGEMGILGRKPRQRDQVELRDLRRPEQRRAHREIRGALAERAELARGIAQGERRAGKQPHRRLAAGSLVNELRPPIGGFAQRERGADGDGELPAFSRLRGASGRTCDKRERRDRGCKSMHRGIWGACTRHGTLDISGFE
jgi:hypothetical protein